MFCFTMYIHMYVCIILYYILYMYIYLQTKFLKYIFHSRNISEKDALHLIYFSPAITKPHGQSNLKRKAFNLRLMVTEGWCMAIMVWQEAGRQAWLNQ